jgi:hypothetical protein
MLRQIFGIAWVFFFILLVLVSCAQLSLCRSLFANPIELDKFSTLSADEVKKLLVDSAYKEIAHLGVVNGFCLLQLNPNQLTNILGVPTARPLVVQFWQEIHAGIPLGFEIIASFLFFSPLYVLLFTGFGWSCRRGIACFD